MHPQVNLPESGQCPICFMDLIPKETGLGDAGDLDLKMSPSAVALAGITTSAIKRGPAEYEVRLSGKLSYAETRIKRISAWVPGRLERLFVDYTGTRVQAGEHLFEIYSPELFAAQEELIQARRQLNSTGSGPDLTRRTFEATLAAAREKLRLLGLSQDQIEMIETRDKASANLTVYSPISGIVIEKSAFEGNYVKTGSQVYTIVDLAELWLTLDAYESDLAWLHPGQKVLFEAEAVPGERYEGVVAFIDPILDEHTRTVKVRANIPNTKGALKPGMFVRATVTSRLKADGKVLSDALAGKWVGPMHPAIVKNEPGNCDICGMPLVTAESLDLVRTGEDQTDPLLVPVSAVLRTGERSIVYVQSPAEEELEFQLREVILGPRAGDHYLVLSGLDEGERVVTHGSFKIDSAMQIAAKPSMMNPDGGLSSTGHEHHDHGASMQERVQEREQSLDTPTEFLKTLDPIYLHYFELQENLAEDGFRQARKAANRLASSVEKAEVPVSMASAAANRWTELQKALQTELEHVEHWVDLEAARKDFERISDLILFLERQFGHTGDLTAYEVFCPMAFENKGASWLQTSRTVSNPYFGASMLRCGEIRQEFASLGE